MTTSHPATQLLEALFDQAPAHLFLEIRPLLPHGGVAPKGRRFFRLRQLQRDGFDQAVPTFLDGKANVFFGVLPRSCPSGLAADVALATCLWADLDRGLPDPWPAAAPLPSVLVESSPGKYQAYWLLQEPTADVDQVERWVRRLAVAVGGDRAATDRARVLRLPGFPNLKYPDRPLARLVEVHPQRRYSLDDLGRRLPHWAEQPAPPEGRVPPEPTRQRREDAFDPHKGGADIPDIMRQEIAAELHRRGAAPYHDGRLIGPCPFPGHNGQSPHNFYCSPVSGRWWCFGEHHPGRRPDKVCVSGGAWDLWAVLFPGRQTPRSGELSASPALSLRGEEGHNSQYSLYEPPTPAPLEALKDAPRHQRSAALLRLVGEMEKANAEASCGVPLKGRCPKPVHGVVREGRVSGKTPWCAGCNTETSAKYLHVTFPEGSYTILRMQRRLGPLAYDAADVEPGVRDIDPADGDRMAARITEEFEAAVGHFRRVQRRLPHDCLGWHFAVGQDQEDMWVELQVLVRCGADLLKVLTELTGGTRKAALFRPDAVIRYDYSGREREQLRRDWAGLLKCALLRLEDDVLFRPVFQSLRGRQLCQAYGDLRTAYSQAGEEERNGQHEDVTTCPVVEDDGKVCGQKLAFFLDPENRHPLNPMACYREKRPEAVELQSGGG